MSAFKCASGTAEMHVQDHQPPTDHRLRPPRVLASQPTVRYAEDAETAHLFTSIRAGYQSQESGDRRDFRTIGDVVHGQVSPNGCAVSNERPLALTPPGLCAVCCQENGLLHGVQTAANASSSGVHKDIWQRLAVPTWWRALSSGICFSAGAWAQDGYRKVGLAVASTAVIAELALSWRQAQLATSRTSCSRFL